MQEVGVSGITNGNKVVRKRGTSAKVFSRQHTKAKVGLSAPSSIGSDHNNRTRDSGPAGGLFCVCDHISGSALLSSGICGRVGAPPNYLMPARNLPHFLHSSVQDEPG